MYILFLINQHINTKVLKVILILILKFLKLTSSLFLQYSFFIIVKFQKQKYSTEKNVCNMDFNVTSKRLVHIVQTNGKTLCVLVLSKRKNIFSCSYSVVSSNLYVQVGRISVCRNYKKLFYNQNTYKAKTESNLLYASVLRLFDINIKYFLKKGIYKWYLKYRKTKRTVFRLTLLTS